MENDTPHDTPSIPDEPAVDSQRPFISSGNAPVENSVAPDMDRFTPNPAPQNTTEEPAPPPPTDAPPVAAFDYDDYYAGADEWTKPEPVSARIEQPPPADPKRSSAPFFLGALAAGIAGSVLTVGILAATGTFADTEATTPTTVVNAAPAVTTPTQPAPVIEIVNDSNAAVDPAAVAQKVVPSIVKVDVFETQAGDNGEELVPTGSGSGVVRSADGYIITNHHVVDGSSAFEVTFEDGRTYEAELIGSDDLTDLAVLRISADNLVPATVGSTDGLSLGDPAIAVGNPLGQEGGASISSGIISAFDRRVDFGDGSSLFGMIQTDAAINSGSSGGALVDAEGNLIGITSAIGVSQAGPEGIGYAIPVELVTRITDEIIETGDVAHPFLGVTIGTYLEEAPDGAIVPSGAEIQTIEGTDSAAGKAGMQPGDVIVRIGDEPIKDQTDLILAVRLYRVGDTVEFEALRNGESMTFDVTFGQRPAEFGG